MTITQLIRALERIKKREGDIQVTFPASAVERPITRVEVVSGPRASLSTEEQEESGE